MAQKSSENWKLLIELEKEVMLPLQEQMAKPQLLLWWDRFSEMQEEILLLLGILALPLFQNPY